MDESAERTVVRPTVDGVRARFAEAGIDVPEQCLSGVASNLGVLQDHSRTLRRLPLDDHRRIALDFKA